MWWSLVLARCPVLGQLSSCCCCCCSCFWGRSCGRTLRPWVEPTPCLRHSDASWWKKLSAASISQTLLQVLDGSTQFLCKQVLLSWRKCKFTLSQCSLHIYGGDANSVPGQLFHEGTEVLHELLWVHTFPSKPLNKLIVDHKQVLQSLKSNSYSVGEFFGSHG